LRPFSHGSAQAEESLQIEREKYDLGKKSITNVLDARSALLDSQTNYSTKPWRTTTRPWPSSAWQ